MLDFLEVTGQTQINTIITIIKQDKFMQWAFH